MAPLDQALRDYDRTLATEVKPLYDRYATLARTAPRAIVVHRGETLQFPPPPPLTPEFDDLVGTYPLSALPPPWVDSLNRVGGSLFERGLGDAARGKVSPPWETHSRRLAGRSLERSEILPLKEVHPDHKPDRDYRAQVVDWSSGEPRIAKARKLLDAVPGSARGPIHFPDGDARAEPLLAALQDAESALRDLGLSVRSKALGIAMRLILDLQPRIYARAQQVLGRDPTSKDLSVLNQVLPPLWLARLQGHHAVQYFCGYNARSQLAAQGGTGSGITDDTSPLPGGGTGTGTGAVTIPGGGTGTGDSSPGGGTVGTGDGRRTATGTGSGRTLRTGTGSGRGTGDGRGSGGG